MTAEASAMLEAAVDCGGFKMVQAVFDSRELEEIRVLAAKIVKREPSIALLGTKESTAARLVFSRSESLTQNMGQLLSEACQLLGGRGGGKPELAQGGGPNVERVEEAIAKAAEKVRSR
jgi:alanyl-tRNA synthetase